MGKNLAFVVRNRRQREQKTNYKKRLEMLKSGQVRLVVRRGNKNITAQLVEYTPKGDNVLFSSTSIELKKKGWRGHGGNLPSAYLVGYNLGKKAKGVVKSAIMDTGIHKIVRGSSLFACMKGVSDAGIIMKFDEKIVPSEERIMGKHISSEYPKMFDEMKKLLEGGAK